jgi:hypothetical protein
MYLTDLTQAIGDRLNTSSPEDWRGGLVIPTDMPVIVGFDPMTEAGDSLTKGIYVTPSSNEYDLSRARVNTNVRTGYSRLMFIVVSIVSPFETKAEVEETVDVSRVSEWSLLRNLQDDLEEFLIQASIPNVKLETIDPEQPLEQALDQRLYLAPITLGYKGC